MNKDKEIDNLVNDTIDTIRIKSKLNAKGLRQLKTLSKYYKIDYESRIVSVTLNYENVNEIIDENISTVDVPFVKRELLVKISDIIHSVPIEFKVDLKIKINDYQNYDSKTIIKAINDAFEIFHYDYHRDRMNSSLKVSALIVFSVVLLGLLFYICSKHWFGQSGDPTHDTIHEIIYTISAVLLWEAVYIIFLPESSYKEVSYFILYRINVIELLDKNNKILETEDNQSIYSRWAVETKLENYSRKFLLITGTALMCIAGFGISDIIESFLIFKGDLILIPYIIILIIYTIIGFLSGLGSISYYRGKGLFRKIILGFGFISLIINITKITYLSYVFKANYQLALKGIVLSSLSLAITIIYLICIFILKRNKKRGEENE